MKEWIQKHQNMCLGLLVAFIIVFSPIFVNMLMNVTCSWVSNKPNDWLGFWGAYLGAIGSFVMALIAYFALRKNNEQLEYIKKQNRPYLFASIRKVLQQKESLNTDNQTPKEVYVTYTYYLSIVNHGNAIALDVKPNIQNSIADAFNDRRLSSVISDINKTKFTIPPKMEKNFVLMVYSSNPDFTSEQLKEQKIFFDAFERSNFDIKIKYLWEFGKDQYEDLFYVKDTTTDATTIVQMLDYIDNHIMKLNEIIAHPKR